MTASVMPSERYSACGSPVSFSRGRTASESMARVRRRRPGGSGVVREADVPTRPDAPARPKTSVGISPVGVAGALMKRVGSDSPDAAAESATSGVPSARQKFRDSSA
jgi:hypothetical protein